MTNVSTLNLNGMVELTYEELITIEGGNWARNASGWIAGAAGAILGGFAGMAAGSVVPVYGTAVGGTAGVVLGYMEGQKAGLDWYDSVFGEEEEDESEE